MAVLIFGAVVMLGGAFYSSCMANARNGVPEQAQGQQKIAFTVGDTPVAADLLQTAIQKQVSDKLSQQAQQGQAGGPSPIVEIMATGEVLNGLISEAARASLVKQLGIPVTDADLTAAYNTRMQDELSGLREQLTMMGQLKPNATDKDVDEAYKKMTGQSLADTRTKQQADFQASLNDKARRASLVITLAPQFLQGYYGKQVNASDADVKASYDRLTVKRIVARTISASKKGTLDERIGEAEKAVKGGMPFEQAMEKFSDDVPVNGKKLGEQTTTLTGSEIASDPNLKPIGTLKAGDVSPIVTVPEGKAIYKLISTKNEAPKDFDANKAKYRKQYVDGIVAGKVNEAVQKLLDSPTLVKFNSPGYKAFYDFLRAQRAADASGKAMQQAYDEAKAAATKNEGYDTRAAILARFAANSVLWSLPTADKNALRPERIDTLTALLQSAESFELRMELVNLDLEAKKNQDAADQLVQAARNNATYDAMGFAHWSQVRDKLLAMQKENQIGADQAKVIEQAQLDWSRNRAKYDEEQQELQREKAKAEAEAKKNAPPVGAPGAAPGTTPGAPTPGPVLPGSNDPIPGPSGAGATTPAAPTSGAPAPGPANPGAKAPTGAPATTAGATAGGAPKR